MQSELKTLSVRMSGIEALQDGLQMARYISLYFLLLDKKLFN